MGLLLEPTREMRSGMHVIALLTQAIPPAARGLCLLSAHPGCHRACRPTNR